MKVVGQYRTGDTKKRPRVAVVLRRQVLAPLVVAVVFLTIPLRGVIWGLGVLFGGATGGPRLSDSNILHAVVDYVNANLGLLDPPNLVLHGVILGAIMGVCALIVSAWNGIPLKGSAEDSGGLWKYASSAFIAGFSAGVLIPLLEVLTRYLNDVGRPELAATLIPPLALLIVVAGLFVEVALLGRSITEAEREWWSRLSALLLIASLLWTVALVSIVYVPAALLASGPVLRTALASGWLATTAFGVLSGRRAQPKGGNGDLLGTIAAVVPPIFLVGFLGAASLFAAHLVNMPPLTFPDANQDWTAVGRYFQGVRGASFWSMIRWLIALAFLFWLGMKQIDVNLFSLHAMYANRLVRCYLGASRPRIRWAERWGDIHDTSAGGGASSLSDWGAPLSAVDREKLKGLHEAALAIVPGTPYDAKRLAENVRKRREVSIEIVKQAVDQLVRDANPETGFDPCDDIPLFDLGIGRTLSKRTYWGPQLLINTTLNLVAGEDLAWQDRKGESFVLTPRYCGSKGVGYARMTEKTRENLTLGRAITISGAAVDPNMSFYQSSSLTAFLTIFNARLGQWMQNPRFPQWKAEGPKFGDRLVSELFGSTDDKDAFIHLTDGGHFENLGVYELIRRRCRYIIAVDAGEDTDASDDNLAQLIAALPDRLRRPHRTRHRPPRAREAQRLQPHSRRRRPRALRGRRQRPGAGDHRLYQDLDDRRRALRRLEVREARPPVPAPADRPAPVVHRRAVRELPRPGRPHRPRRLLRHRAPGSRRADLERARRPRGLHPRKSAAFLLAPEPLGDGARRPRRALHAGGRGVDPIPARHPQGTRAGHVESGPLSRAVRRHGEGPGQRLRIIPPTRRAARGLADDPAHGERLDQPPPQGAQRPPHGPRLDERLPPLDRHESVPPPLAHYEVGV